MKNLYARFVLWLIGPALDCRESSGSESDLSPAQRTMVDEAICRLVASGCTDPELIQAAAGGLAVALVSKRRATSDG
ncbi:hypothetical protein CF68_33165 [Cupriavidus sp. SK-4]|uniref:hypothetical protein n=1 Tax=Cupriavidus sp. SK-4 TaxID=574750 RepID=UPI0004488B2A|nr:hypothetical protein [Cupriavidus sp. SK-4]EYS89537.1 hypothetical protein CF68_33165 [Cupriavidus sp. SK-4]